MEEVNKMDDEDNLPSTTMLKEIIINVVKQQNVGKKVGRAATEEKPISTATMNKILSMLPIYSAKGNFISYPSNL
jgi:hypothetical protein